MADDKLGDLASLITYNPKLRAEYFENPGKVLAWAIPRAHLVERVFSLAAPERTRTLRAQLGSQVEAMISSDSRLVSAREAAFEKNVFLSDALRNPQRTFDFIVRLSTLAFIIGGSFLIGAFVAAVFGDGTTEKAVLGGLSGGGGAATTLGAVFAISRDAVRKANSDNAQIRLILTGFATEITHCRAIKIRTFGDAQRRNREIREAMNEAVRKIEKYAELDETKPKEKEPQEKQKKAEMAGEQ